MYKKTAELKKIVITGGHHSSALPVIKILKQEHPDIQIIWLGHKHSLKGDKNPTLEFIEITSLGIPFYELRAGKVYKTFDLFRLLKVPIGFFQAVYLLSKIKPAVVLSFGGYLAVPVVIASRLLGIPSLTHEQTVVAGYANKVIGYFADRILISWESSRKFFKPEKVVYTGLPLREEVFQVSSSNFRLTPNIPTVFLIAGKTGSHKLNMLVLELLPQLLKKVNFIHQCGDYSEFNDFETLSTKYSEIKDTSVGSYNLTKFIFGDSIGEAYAKSDLVISRSGAHICAELIALKKPCILVPIPWVSHNEQYENAQTLVRAGIAQIINESELTSETVLSQVEHMLQTATSVTEKSSTPAYVNNAAKKIIQEIFDLHEKTYSNSIQH